MTDNEQLTLWLGAFRYYCGRMTYAVGDFCDLLIREWPNLSEPTRALIKRDLEAEFDDDDRMRAIPGQARYPLGHDCDRKEWEKVRRLWK